MTDLQGKRYLVVGAGGRIGRGLVAELVRQRARVVAIEHDAAGFDVLQDFDEATVERRLCDITDPGSVTALFAGLEPGSADGAVNSAYPRNANYGRKFFEVEYSDFCENTSAHLGGYFLFMQQCMKFAMDGGREFSFVNVSSIYGVMAPRFEVYGESDMTMPVEYAAIKSGLIHLTKYAAALTKGSSFRVNSISPGGIAADQPEQFVKKYNAFCGRKGLLDVEDLLGSLVYLLSDASRYLSGQNLVVDDGFSL